MGAPFYYGAMKSVRHGAANMDVLVVLGTTSAWLYGVILIFLKLGLSDQASETDTIIDEVSDHSHHADHATDHHEVHEHAHNFEISASLITVILLGKYLESLSQK